MKIVCSSNLFKPLKKRVITYIQLQNWGLTSFYIKCNCDKIHSQILFFISFEEFEKNILYTCTLEVSIFFSSVQIFNHKSNSNEDIHLVHIEPKIRSLEPLTYQRIADLFWCGLDQPRPLAEKQWRSADRLGALEI